MFFAPMTFAMKDGRTAILRSPNPEKDAADLVQYLYDTAADTPFVLRTPAEIRYTVEGEEAFLRNVVDNPDACMLVCEVDGKLAGNCQITFRRGIKTRHRCDIAIALRKAYWGNGIGTAMFTEMERLARQREGVTVMELEFIEGNARARGLYEKMGFRIVGMHPDAIRQENGELAALYLMQKQL